MSGVPFRLVQVSDIHLSRQRAYFLDNWRVFVDLMAEERPDLIVVSGDVSLDGADHPDDLAFAALEIARLPCPTLVLPGNHDIGEPPAVARLGQPVDTQRLLAWTRHFGADRFARDAGPWRLLGLDSEIMGSGLPEEAAQWAFLDAELAAAGTRPVGLFLHRPLFAGRADEPSSRSALVAEARTRLLDRLARHRVRFCASGHLHEHLVRRHGATTLLWAPGTSFVTPGRRRPAALRGLPQSGYVRWTLAGRRFRHELVRPERMIDLDMTRWMLARGSTVHLPPRPVGGGAAPCPQPPEERA